MENTCKPRPHPLVFLNPYLNQAKPLWIVRGVCDPGGGGRAAGIRMLP